MTIYSGGWWYQDHCLLIKTYKSPVIRWRYPGEEWQEIEGDNYQVVDDAPIYNTDRRKFVTIDVWVIANGNGNRKYHTEDVIDGQLIKMAFVESNVFIAPIFKMELKKLSYKTLSLQVTYQDRDTNGNCRQSLKSINLYYLTSYTGYELKAQTWFNPSGTDASDRNNYKVGIKQDLGIQQFDIQPYNSPNPPQSCTNPIPINCTFTITKNGQIVHTETRDICPEVEKLPCQAQPIEKLEFQTSPLGYIATSNKSFSQDGQTAVDIPTGCVDVYNVIPSVPIGGTIGSSGVPIWSFKGQFCSSTGCPEPEILHLDGLCDPCQSCPSDTCAVECDEQICCYDESGIAVKTIALNNYCGGQS